MEVVYENSIVKWLYDGNEVVYEANGIEFATYGEQSIYIEVLLGETYEYRFVNFYGKDICRYDENNIISIFDENSRKYEIQLEEINDVLFFNGKIYVMNLRTEIRIFNCSGKSEGVIKPPYGYTYTRFCNSSGIAIVCEGDISHADSYGRVDYKFEYDMICNDWRKKTVTY